MFRLALAFPLRGIRSGSAQHDKVEEFISQTETPPHFQFPWCFWVLRVKYRVGAASPTEDSSMTKRSRALALAALVFFFGVGHGQITRRPAIKDPLLHDLMDRAVATHSDSLLVLKDGKPVLEYYSHVGRRRIELMSCTKSVVSFAIGRLIDQGKIRSLDQPVHDFYPEWNQGQKKLITIRHLLNHTSGLQNVPNARVEIYPSRDFIQLALNARVETEPGKIFSYNNKAVNLLAGIIQKASGKRMDIYFHYEIFKPMGIINYRWSTDRAGNPQVMAGLQLTARDFAKFGELVLNNGRWGSTQIVSPRWIAESMTPQTVPSYGLLWWLTPGDMDIVIDDAKFREFEEAGIDPEIISKLQPLRNKMMHSTREFSADLNQTLDATSLQTLTDQLRSKGLRLSRFNVREIEIYSGNGDLGQFLAICPKEKLVAVRQVSAKPTYNRTTDTLSDFVGIVQTACHAYLHGSDAGH